MKHTIDEHLRLQESKWLCLEFFRLVFAHVVLNVQLHFENIIPVPNMTNPHIFSHFIDVRDKSCSIYIY